MIRKTILVAVAVLCPVSAALADLNPQPLPFAQDWTNAALITIDDDWSGVPGIIGYRGDSLTAATGTDPQTITADSGLPEGLVVDVNADETNPNGFATGGLAEFDIANDAVALNGSGTADAPSLVISVNTSLLNTITITYNLRDLDGSADNSTQQVALQYRTGGSGSWTNVAAGYVGDASSGPSLATLVTPVSVTGPAAWDNQANLQFRVITTNAIGNDEWIGIDDITVTGLPEPGTLALLGIGALALIRRRR